MKWISILQAAKLTGLSTSGVKYHVQQCNVRPALFVQRKRKLGQYSVWEIDRDSFLSYLKGVQKGE